MYQLLLMILLHRAKWIWDRSIFFIIKSHHLTIYCFRISENLHEICSIWAQNCFCYCFWTILQQLASLKLFRNNNKNNFALKCCKFLANLCKSSEILEQCHVKWWLKYRNNRSVSWRLCCILKSIKRSPWLSLKKWLFMSWAFLKTLRPKEVAWSKISKYKLLIFTSFDTVNW
jgi:hypothetical protein